MKHFVILLALCLLGYASYQLATRAQRRKSLRFLSKHGVRAALVVIVLLICLLAATRFSSISIV